jgi:hypothetical protein
MALVNAATLIAELGDLSRFANTRQLIAYLGWVPSEHSSGASVKHGGLTKQRSPRAADRSMVLPCPGPGQSRVAAPTGSVAPEIREIAWKAQLRLCSRYRKLARSGKRHCRDRQ